MSSPQSKWREKNQEKVKAARDRYYAANRERILENARQWRKNNPNRKLPTQNQVRDRHYKHKYGITLLEYEDLHSAQQGVCVLCLCPETAKTKSGEVARLVVDHDHMTGKVRGLLCRNCNSALGKFKESEEILERAKLYLRGNKTYPA